MVKFNKKIIIAVLALLVSISSVLGASYAWFSMNNKVKLATVNVIATAPSNMLISTDAENWNSAVVSNVNVEGGFSPVSTADGKVFFALADTSNLMTTGGRVNESGLSIDSNGVVVKSHAVAFEEVEQIDNINHYYACFPLYIKASKGSNATQDFKIFLDKFEVTSNDANLMIDKTVRISITEMATRNTLVNVQNVGSDAIVTSSATLPEGAAGTHIFKIDSSAVKPISSVDSNGIPTLAEDPALMLPDSEHHCFTIDYLGDEYTAIVVRIWLEGQHIDCVNEIQDKTVTVSLGWKVGGIGE